MIQVVVRFLIAIKRDSLQVALKVSPLVVLKGTMKVMTTVLQMVMKLDMPALKLSSLQRHTTKVSPLVKL